MIKFFACKNPSPLPIILYLPAAAAAETGNITLDRKAIFINVQIIVARYPDPHVARSGDKQSGAGGGGGIGYSGASGAAPSAGQGPEEEKAPEERDSVPFPFAVFQFCQYLSSEAGASLTMDPGAWGAAFTDSRVTRRARRQRTFMADIDGINDDTVRNLFSIYTEDLITQLHTLSAV